MESIGIIAEYNPFHNGHLYQIKKIKEKYPDSYLILVMSGNFTERGTPSLIDKWKKTEIALKAGLDLVVELPFPFATQSADYFSYGAITILEKLKVKRLIFGSESDNIEDLKLIATTELNNPEFDKLVRIYSKFGNNYPTSLSLALKDLTGKEITTPNDLLGISYLKTIIKHNYKIIPETIKRTNSYHEKELNEEISSATAIRKALKENIDISSQVPDFVLKYLNSFHTIEDYFPLLKYKILTEEDLSIYNTVDEGLDKLLKKEISNATSYADLISKLKSKRYTYNKISRMLNHIFCSFTKEENKKVRYLEYIRILGFTEKGKNYLNEIKNEINLPILNKYNTKYDSLKIEKRITDLYSFIYEDISKKEIQNIPIYIKEKQD